MEFTVALIHTWSMKKVKALADQNWGHFWLPYKQEKENLLHRQSSLPKISLALLSLQAAESMKRKRKITINLNVSLFSPSGLKYPTKDLLNPS